MNSEWLLDFLTLVEAGGFARAAEKRAITQPTFSRRIRSLEEWVGVTLIDRSTHTMRLTPAGESFQSVAEQTLHRLQVGRDEARAIAKSSSETLKFASTHALSFTFIPSFWRDFDKNNPTIVSIGIIADHMTACEKLMVKGDVQFLFCHHHQSVKSNFEKGFKSIQVGTDVLLPVISPKLAQEIEPTKAPQLSFSPTSGMGKILSVLEANYGNSRKEKPVLTSHLASVLTAMAREGRGVAWTVLSLVKEDLETGTLLQIGGAENEVPIEIRLWRHVTRQSPSAENFWQQIVEYHRE